MSLKEFFRFLANPFRYRQENATGIEKLMDDALTILQEIRKGQEEMALNLDALRAEVERAKTVQESAVTLLHALAAEVGKIAADLAAELDEDNEHVGALEELAGKLKASTDALADGIAASDDVFEIPAQPEPELPEAPVEAPEEAETPVEEVPVEEVPVEEVPAEETPVEEAPVEEVPVEEVPVAEEPVVEEPVAEEPVAEEVPVEAPVEEVPVEEVPVVEEPVAEEPVAEEVPAEVPAEEAPVTEEVPVEAPVEEAPVEEVPAEEKPVE